MAEVCEKWQMIAGKVIGFNPMTYFECTMPDARATPLDLSPPAGMNTEMRWRGVVWPTENLAACTAQGARMLDMKDMKAGEKIKEDGFKCVDAKTGETQIDFSVLRSCAADKDPNAAGSCKSDVIVKPKAKVASAAASSARKHD